MSTDLDSALFLISSINKSLNNGLKHFDKRGNQLTDVKEILKCIVNEGRVNIYKPFSKTITINKEISNETYQKLS